MLVPVFALLTAVLVVTTPRAVRPQDSDNAGFALAAVIGAAMGVLLAAMTQRQKRSAAIIRDKPRRAVLIGETILSCILPMDSQEEAIVNILDFYDRKRERLGKWAVLPFWCQLIQIAWPYLLDGARRVVTLGIFHWLGHGCAQAWEFYQRTRK